MALALFPVALVGAESSVNLFSNSVLQVVEPGAGIGVLGLFIAALSIGVDALSASDLIRLQNQKYLRRP